MSTVASAVQSAFALHDEWRLTAGIQYDVVVELTLSEVENNRHLGPFQVIFEAFDGGGQRTTSYRRTAKVNEKRSLFSLVITILYLNWIEFFNFFSCSECNRSFYSYSAPGSYFFKQEFQSRGSF
ncbi:unnamed protein product [Toxocara canis]|uniref:Seipin n=1 Tax=Toxocara canis TaxID=6265 RepID=A0A183UH72_TOXCA|nr:unnamed protein product [Toxocara canis]